MKTYTFAAGGLICSIVWLVLLVVTAFSAVVLGIGLLGALYVLNGTSSAG